MRKTRTIHPPARPVCAAVAAALLAMSVPPAAAQDQAPASERPATRVASSW